MKNNIVSFLVVFLIIVCGYVAVGPFITIYVIKSGIEQKNPKRISANVDFSALRTNLKEQFNALLMKESQSELKDNPFSALGMAVASKLIEEMVDSFVTPNSLENLMMGKKPQESKDEEGSDKSNSQKPEPFKNARYTYDSLSKFSACVKVDEGEEIRFVFSRNGLSWKLSNILLPTSIFEGKGSISTNNQLTKKPPISAEQPAIDNTDKYKSEIEHYNELIRLNPNDADNYYQRGVSFYLLGQNQRAIEDFNKAIILKPDFVDAYSIRGDIYGRLRQNQRAIEDYTQAIILKPDLVEAYEMRGLTYMVVGNIELGCRDAKKVCQLGGDCDFLYKAMSKGYCR